MLFFDDLKKGKYMAKNRMSTTSVQLNETQFDRLEQIKKILDATSNAEVLRKAFDFYVKEQFPQLQN